MSLRMAPTVGLVVLLLLLASSSAAFSSVGSRYHPHAKRQQRAMEATRRRPFVVSQRTVVLWSSSGDNGNNNDEKKDEKKNGLSFDDATQAIRQEEDDVRMQARGMDSDEDNRKFEAKRTSYEDMRAKIRSRATDLGKEKSVATAQAIKEATARAMAGESDQPQLNLSDFGSGTSGNDPEDDLTEEVKKELDKVGQLSYLQQAIHEIQNTQFPTPIATLKQAGLMALIFIVTATVILKVDELLRIQITEWGFIPKSGEMLDYSDLQLPEGFTDAMSDADLQKM